MIFPLLGSKGAAAKVLVARARVVSNVEVCIPESVENRIQQIVSSKINIVRDSGGDIIILCYSTSLGARKDKFE